MISRMLASLRYQARRHRLIVRVLDLVLVGPMMLAAVFLRTGRRLGFPAKLPVTRAALDRVGIFPVRHHYYEPLVVPGDVLKPSSEPRSIAGLNLDTERQLEFLRGLRYGAETNRLPSSRQPDGVFTYDNESFGAGDAELFYSMVRRLRPRRIYEIGSGYSTLITRLGIAQNRLENPAYSCDHTCIEPYENPWLEESGPTIIRSRVEDVPLEFFLGLEPGDILSIDSTHCIRPQSDVLFEYLSVIGTIAPGVYVHAHDVFTPRDYPRSWILEQKRMWNEQYLLEALLCHTTRYEVVIALNHLFHEHPYEVGLAFPLLAGNTHDEPGSFWFLCR